MERFSEKELRLMINNDKLFDEYDLGNMYSVFEKDTIKKNCTVCHLIYEGNEDKFYCRKITYCKNCYRNASRQRIKN